MGILDTASQAEKTDIPVLVEMARRNGGPGPWRQLMQILRHLIVHRGFTIDDYYTYGLWHPRLAPAMKKGLLTGGARNGYNKALMLKNGVDQSDLINDKLVTEGLFRCAGIPTVQTLAVVGSAADAPGVIAIDDADALANYLRECRDYPLFGKPRADSLANGVVGIDGVSGHEVTVSDGRTVELSTLIAEIFASYSDGYLIQRKYLADPEFQAHAGRSIPGLRVVTLRTAAGIEAYYAVVRLPAPDAMHDGASAAGRAWALVDLDSGQIERIRPYRKPHAADLTHWADPDTPLAGCVLPRWSETIAMCRKAHGLFPGHGILGWDVFLTPDGPLINEVNANPGHLYQVVAMKGQRAGQMEKMYRCALSFARGAG